MRNSDVAQTGLDSEIAVGRAAPRTTVPLRMIISKGRGLVMGPELAVADGALWLLAGDRGGVAEDARLSALAQICYFGRHRELHAMSKHPTSSDPNSADCAQLDLCGDGGTTDQPNLR